MAREFCGIAPVGGGALNGQPAAVNPPIPDSNWTESFYCSRDAVGASAAGAVRAFYTDHTNAPRDYVVCGVLRNLAAPPKCSTYAINSRGNFNNTLIY